jgi:hypothetical protein
MRHLVWLHLRHIVASDDTYASAAIASQLTDHHPTLPLHSCPVRHRPSPAWRTSRQGPGANPHNAPCSPISPLSCPAAVVADLQPCPDHHCRLGRPRRWRVVTIPRTPGRRPESATSLHSSPHQTAWEAIRRVGTLPGYQFPRGRTGSRGGEPPRTLRPCGDPAAPCPCPSRVRFRCRGAIERAAVSKSVSKPVLRVNEPRGSGL